MTHVTCRLTAKNRDQLRNPTLGNRVWATFIFLVLVGLQSFMRFYSDVGVDVDCWHYFLMYFVISAALRRNNRGNKKNNNIYTVIQKLENK